LKRLLEEEQELMVIVAIKSRERKANVGFKVLLFWFEGSKIRKFGYFTLPAHSDLSLFQLSPLFL